ncbi:MAG: RHS repeat protein [Muribaculaceae bacterium]|nr:RHS repeat protein [Muribaculaceae bacterium]
MKKLLLILILSFGFQSMNGQNIIHPKIAGPGGVWVNSYNGVLFFGLTDIETQNSAMPLQLRFYYNSSANKRNYGYGLGFSLGCEMRYELDSMNNVIIEAGDGRTDTYVRYGDDYVSPAGVFSTLVYSEDRFVLTDKTGQKFEFSDASHKKLTALVDRHGNRTTLTYSPDSMLVEVQDAVGHTITLEYTNKMMTRATASFLNGSINYAYDSKNRLIKRTDAMGYSTVYDYDRNNRIDEITDANGHKTHIYYNASGMTSRLKTDVSDKSIRYDGDKTVFVDYTEPKNQYSYYRWDEKGRVIEKAGLCCGVQSKMEYDEDDNVIKRIDANGNITTYTYDERGNMLSQTDPNGNTERFTYDTKFNQVTSYQDKNGNIYSLSYNSTGDLTLLSGPEGFSNSFTYNEQGWPATTTDANSNVTRTTYNADGTLAQVMDAAGNTKSYAYDQCGNITSVTDGRGNTTTYAYDHNNKIVSQTDALGHTTTISYDKVGNIVRVKDAKNQITAHTYDELRRMLTMTDPQGGVYTFEYDGKGNVLTATDPLGNQQTFTWNEKNKLFSKTNAEGETTSYDYDAKGNLFAMFLPNGNVISYDYDKLDRIEQISDNLGIIAHFTYDANGNRLTVTDGLNRTISYTYDALNRLVSKTLPTGATTSYEYDNNSNLLSITDAKGNATTYTYSSLNQQLTNTDALNAKSQFEYDSNGNMIRTIDAKGNATTFTYDALNHNTVITLANGSSKQYTYDELGRIIASKDLAGNEFQYTYDALGNLLSKTYPDGLTDSYVYDAKSRLISAVNKDAKMSFTYDHVNRLSSETLNGKVTSYNYNVAAGKRTIIYPSGLNVVEQLNARGLISSILQNGNEVASMSYNAIGQKTSQTYANGITTNYAYNQNGWLYEIKDDHNVLNLQMTYDAIGNITERKNVLNSAHNENYGYDAISQLTSFKRGTTVDNSYQYDLMGNRIRSIENGLVTNYTSNNVNAYTNITGCLNFTPQYDGNGNMLNDDKHTYSYDLNNNLVSVDGIDGVYKYDALGRCIAKNNTLFYYAGNQMVEVVTNGANTSYLYGNNIDETLQMTKGSSQYYYHSNHLGSTMALSDANGATIEQVDYDAFGLPTFLDVNNNPTTQSSIGNNILFTGRNYDAEFSTYYYRARFMQPSIGRFMQHDPLLYKDAMNLYLYVGNMPIMKVDPMGEESKSCDDDKCKALNPKKNRPNDFTMDCDYCGADGESRYPNFGSRAFNLACYNHDLCYAYHIPKSLCDQKFYHDMKDSYVGIFS